MRIGRNPPTGEEVIIDETDAPAFKAGKGFKDAVKKRTYDFSRRGDHAPLFLCLTKSIILGSDCIFYTNLVIKLKTLLTNNRKMISYKICCYDKIC